uniref:Reverse transcriptase/retrotransposon-derived protein RNase H-like domain-containing protein n=1 Tax=Strigamia maritima TaxID=126957 RepID=T1IGT5_STRMM
MSTQPPSSLRPGITFTVEDNEVFAIRQEARERRLEDRMFNRITEAFDAAIARTPPEVPVTPRVMQEPLAPHVSQVGGPAGHPKQPYEGLGDFFNPVGTTTIPTPVTTTMTTTTLPTYTIASSLAPPSLMSTRQSIRTINEGIMSEVLRTKMNITYQEPKTKEKLSLSSPSLQRGAAPAYDLLGQYSCHSQTGTKKQRAGEPTSNFLSEIIYYLEITGIKDKELQWQTAHNKLQTEVVQIARAWGINSIDEAMKMAMLLQAFEAEPNPESDTSSSSNDDVLPDVAPAANKPSAIIQTVESAENTPHTCPTHVVTFQPSPSPPTNVTCPLHGTWRKTKDRWFLIDKKSWKPLCPTCGKLWAPQGNDQGPMASGKSTGQTTNKKTKTDLKPKIANLLAPDVDETVKEVTNKELITPNLFNFVMLSPDEVTKTKEPIVEITTKDRRNPHASYVKLTWTNLSFVALLDTGAQTCLMSQRLLEKLQEKMSLPLVKLNEKIRTAADEYVQCTGSMQLAIRAPLAIIKFTCLVIPKTSQDLLLGRDFCRAVGLQEDYVQGQWYLSGTTEKRPFLTIEQAQNSEPVLLFPVETEEKKPPTTDIQTVSISEINCVLLHYRSSLQEKFEYPNDDAQRRVKKIRHRVQTNKWSPIWSPKRKENTFSPRPPSKMNRRWSFSQSCRLKRQKSRAKKIQPIVDQLNSKAWELLSDEDGSPVNTDESSTSEDSDKSHQLGLDLPPTLESTDNQHQKVFEELKQQLAEPTLQRKSPDWKKPYILQADASYSGLGAALMQLNERGERISIAFAS